MNNDLEQFSEETLIFYRNILSIDFGGNSKIDIPQSSMLALVNIALAAKQAKPTFEEWLSSRTGTIEVDCGCVTTEAFYHWLKVAYEATPHPAHTEQDGWTSSYAANVALVMLDRIDTTDPVDDDRIEGIQRIIRQLVNSPVIPDGWKLVPIEPTQEMVDAHISGMQSAGFSCAYRDMLTAAPKPESE